MQRVPSITLPTLLQAIGFDSETNPNRTSERVLQVYQFGSRVFGCYREDSDWDFRIVIAEYTGKTHPPSPIGLLLIIITSNNDYR